jgi:hypothetical protein
MTMLYKDMTDDGLRTAYWDLRRSAARTPSPPAERGSVVMDSTTARLHLVNRVRRMSDGQLAKVFDRVQHSKDIDRETGWKIMMAVSGEYRRRHATR